MNWDEVGAVGQVLGSVAVFITLGYLATQVRHARDEVRRSVMHARLEMVRQQMITLATDTDLNAAYANANAVLGTPLHPFIAELVNRFALPAEMAYRLMAMEGAWVQVRSDAILNLDLMSAPDRAQFEARTRASYQEGTISGLFYRHMKPTFSADVARYIDNLLATR